MQPDAHEEGPGEPLGLAGAAVSPMGYAGPVTYATSEWIGERMSTPP